MKNEEIGRLIRESHVPESRWTGKSRPERNAEILLALARGIDELDAANEEEMARRARAIEALTAGAQALRGDFHETAGKRWEKEDEERLAEALGAGMSVSDMAKLLGRSERAVWMKLENTRVSERAEGERREAMQAAWRRIMRERE